MSTTARVYDAFHDAAYVYVDEDHELAIVWNGSLTFNIYALPGLECVDVFTAGTAVGDRWDARERCTSWFANLDGGDED